jgi:CDP-glucose 4,6-dehydratase
MEETNAMNIVENKSILITGGAGFTGSHVAEQLLQQKSKIIIPYRHLFPYSYIATEQLEKKVTLVACDITDFAAIRNLFDTYPIDYIIHFAAQGSIPNPDKMIALMENNVMGTIHVLEAARRSSHCKGFIMVSSDKAYGKKSSTYQETDPVGGDHPYEVSKAAGDLLARAYFKTFNVPVIVVRAGNIYGPGDLSTNRIVPSIIRTAITNEPLHLRSDGTFLRDYIYVSDVARAYVTILKNFTSQVGQIFHVSSDRSYSVIELIEIAARTLKRPIPYTVQNTALNEIPAQHIESNRIKSLGWKQQESLINGLAKTFEWYSRHPDVFLTS